MFKLIRAPLLFLFIALVLGSQSVMAETIGLMERYALASDRDAMLAELIPGSEDYYFYHCLHYQTTGQLERSEAILKDWLAEHKGRETPAITAMLDRQRLLTYQDSPQRTIDYLVRRLGVKLNHSPPATKGERRYPSKLNAAQLDVDQLVKDALRRNDPLKPVGMRHLAELFRKGKTAGIPINLHEFLKRVDGAYLQDLDQLVIAELNLRAAKDRRFGDLNAHQYLTLEELQTVGAMVDDVADDNAFVQAVLQRLRSDGDSDPSQQRDIQLEYLQRAEAYVRQLPPSYNSLKASACYRLMEANLAADVFDRELFLRYLSLPRSSPIVHPDLVRRQVQKANLSDNFMDLAMLPPIGDERSLVRTYLEHFLSDAENIDEFSQHLQPDYLRRVFAETKLLYGVGKQEQWYKMLEAPQRQAIRDAIELTLPPQNQKQFRQDEPTKLLVDVKNVNELVVRIYEINAPSYFRTHEKPIDTDVDLDGLIATDERKLNFQQPAEVRHRERIELKEITGRGVWVVDLVGKGLRARALIRRGAIHHVASTTADGMLFTIIDEEREPIAGATMLVGSREFVADEHGHISVPPVADQVDRRAIISDGEIAEQIKFRHLRESYQLSAGMLVDRTLLQTGGVAKLLIRPRLTMSGQPVDPGMLTDVSVSIRALDLENLATTHEVDDIKLNQMNELVVPFRVPARLSELKVSLSGSVTNLSTSQQQSLQTTRSWDIAGVRRTNHTHDVFLTRDGDRFVMDVRGRSGELIPHATVSVSLWTDARQAAVEQTLQSDEHGRVDLGKLAGVTHIRYALPSGLSHERNLSLNVAVWPDELHTTTNQDIRLPLSEPIADVAAEYRLLEVRGGSYHADHTNRLTMKDGFLLIGELPAGDYHLVNRQTSQITGIVVVDGPVHGLVATGKVRHRSLSPNRPIGIDSIENVDGDLKIQLTGAIKLARIHVYASHYFDAMAGISSLKLPNPPLSGRRVVIPRCGHVSDLRLGDEYQYVLRRRYAAKYPGVMLPQPSVLLNPWETEETFNTSKAAYEGQAVPPSASAESAPDYRRAAAGAGGQAQSTSSDFDFLADSGAITANLRPDDRGVVTIPADLVKGLPIVQIIISDPVNLLHRTITTASQDVETVDLRLADALDADQPVSFERAVSIVSQDNPLEINRLGSAQLQVYGSFGALMTLYKTLVNDPRLAEFDPLAVWHTLDAAEKSEAYSRLAGHELHLFLWSYDRRYFDNVVRPYLANKKEKQFVDHWLLENDLSAYTTLWRYNQLNAAERALLAIRLPEARELVRRELRERVARLDVNHQLVRRRIESALTLEGMDSGVRKGRSLNRFSRIAGDKIVADEVRSIEKRLELSRELEEESLRSATLEDGLQMPDFDQDAFGAFGRRGEISRDRGRGFYRELDSTKQWAESHWDRVRTVGSNAPENLIAVDSFWMDLANGDSDAIGVSSHLLQPATNRHAALVALAMSGLPLQEGKINLPTEPDEKYAPEYAVAVVTKRLRLLDAADNQSNLLIGQRFARLEQSDGDRKKPAEEPNEFLTGVAYQGQTVVSNPTAEPKTVDVFWQIPAGSVPLGGSQTTDSRTIELKPFAVEAITYQFYFPIQGKFVHYPATVAADGKLLSRGTEKEFNVVQQASQDDQITWQKVAHTGTPQQITEFLEQANLRDLNWMLVAHRMSDQEVYRAVIQTLSDAKLAIPELWAYSFKHRDEPAMKEYLSLREDLTSRTGPVLRSPLLKVEPIERRTHELLEYAPLVRARIHPLRDEHEILNPTFLKQYRGFVRVLGYVASIDPEDKLVLTYYLLLQNRIAEAIDAFTEIRRAEVATQLQYDYLDAYLAMHREDFAHAEKIARQYESHPVPRWSLRFTEMASQLNQRRNLRQVEQLVSVEGKEEPPPIREGSGDLAVIDRERQQESASEEQPEVVVRVEGDSLRIDHRRAKEVELKLYGVDLELLFSKAPFVRDGLQRMAMVRPLRQERIEFDESNGTGRFDLDENLRRQTLLVEAVAGASRSTALSYGGEITTYVSESYGQLQTTDAKSRRPISTAYVKVYAKYPDGSVRFYKDGYTDARGRFDYASISANDAKGASRFAILVMSDEKGSSLHDVAPPNQ